MEITCIYGLRAGTANIYISHENAEDYYSLNCSYYVTNVCVPKRDYRALLIGNRYSGTDDELSSTDNDMSAMWDMLNSMEKTEYDVTARYDLKGEEMRTIIMEHFEDADVNDVSLIFVFVHGNPKEGPSLGGLTGTDKFALNPIVLKEACDYITGKKIMLLGSCHSGAHIGKDLSSGVTIEQTLANEGYYVLAAAHSTESALELTKEKRSLFTYWLCYGSGFDEMNDVELDSMPADANGNGEITLKECYDYVYAHVLEESEEKTLANDQHVQVYPENSDFVLWAK